MAMIAFKHLRTWASAPYLFLACVSLSALFLGYSPEVMRLADPFQTLARFLDVPHLVFVWLLALSLFSIHSERRFLYAGLGIIYCLPLLWFRVGALGWMSYPPKWVHVIVSVFSVALVLHVIFKTARGWRDDLINERRRTRLLFFTLIFLTTLIAAITEFFDFETYGFDRATVKILTIWPAIFFTAIWLLDLNLERVKFTTQYSHTYDVLTEKQTAHISALKALMTKQKIYTNPALTISDLARELGVTQHRLREVINQYMGHKNFSTFLNSYRIEAVKADLCNPKMRDIPILTIAMDHGFNSLTTFNRVFKNLEGQTPSEFRQNNA